MAEAISRDSINEFRSRNNGQKLFKNKETLFKGN